MTKINLIKIEKKKAFVEVQILIATMLNVFFALMVHFWSQGLTKTIFTSVHDGQLMQVRQKMIIHSLL